MKLALVGNTPKTDLDLVEKVAKAAFSHLKVLNTPGEIELRFLSRAKIQELNYAYRQINRPTDVLSFNIATDPLVGQVFICYTYAKENAQKYGKKPDDEVALLVVHGVLHILGYDHEDAEAANKMEQIEREILK
jgi:probable rRNA maturation factor